MSKVQIRDLVVEDLYRAETELAFFARNIKTIDPKAPANQRIKPYPYDAKPYIPALLYELSTTKKVAVYKSRQMMVTWSSSIIVSHEAIFMPGSDIGLISKKQEDAGEIIGRVKFMVEQLPAHWHLGLPEMQFYKGKGGALTKMIVKHADRPDSVVQAYPQGGDQVRMHSFSLVYWDEVGFCDDKEARATYAALLPAIEGGGRLILTSTPPRDTEHFWNQLVEGRYFL